MREENSPTVHGEPGEDPETRIRNPSPQRRNAQGGIHLQSHDLILRESKPKNLESPFSDLEGFLTPNNKFYVRNHFDIPEISDSSWRLKIEGAIDKPIEIGIQDIKRMPSHVLTAMLECAGNGRAYLEPKAKGIPWGAGAVSNAEWTGVPLRDLLSRAGLKPGALEVILEGADRGTIDEEPKTPGDIHFARSIPLVKALDDVFLAYEMNGEVLTPEHGRPLRAIVPGWYGMASVKWLSRIVVTDRHFNGYFQTLEYSIFERHSGIPTLVPLAENAVKAEIARPAMGESVLRGGEYRVLGAAWAGESMVRQVEVSVDDGEHWQLARLLGDPVRHAWTLWDWFWRVPERAGHYRLMARATDARDRTQPDHRNEDLRTVMIHHVVPIEVQVK
ncbi:sulfite oxidase [Singulisphaera sp. PoT]|uniref:sulfite oxidase n=1 Tax=Singulisphaera sp. PoT TaxID=3411797 RepID=UPI003BF5C8B2